MGGLEGMGKKHRTHHQKKAPPKYLLKTGPGFSKFFRPNELHFSNFFAPHFVQNFGGALRENVWWRVVSLWENKHHETHHQKLAEFFRKFGASFRIFWGLVWFKILVAPFIFGGGKNIRFSTVFGGGGGFCAAEYF